MLICDTERRPLPKDKQWHRTIYHDIEGVPFISVAGLAFSASSSPGQDKFTQRPQSSSFLGLPYRILNMNPKRNYYGAYG